MKEDGTLQVDLRSDSYFIRENMPIEVRDSKMTLIHRTNDERYFTLPAGLYEVSAFLEDGRKHSQLVQVKEGQNTPVEFSIDTENRATKMSKGSSVMLETLSVTAAMSQPDDELSYDLSPHLIDVDGATLVTQISAGLVFECETPPQVVPTALMSFANKQYRISLPVSSDSPIPEENTCIVGIEETSQGPHLHAWISPTRKVANALQNMLTSGYVIHAGNAAEEAVDLLRSKYSDPTGAALGAIILHKVGRLRKRTSWVRNLARDFDWLPDGKVFLAILTIDEDKDEALEYALRASKQRMLYTESHSLLLDILRRWPKKDHDDDDKARIHNAIRRLSVKSPYIDWDSICLSYSVEEEID